ncbi:NAD(P)-binding domain-containing protein [Rhodohalobacter halophilus]|uniref:hypothetical protein n=1 Tax=Rhodohalobacter halophilus TaxID=1812810 RepID=UPI00083F7653|nr:hypothetical protein [Rhodohalobacter halophilus]
MPITKQTVAIIGSKSILGVSIAKGLCSENYKLLLFDEDDTFAGQLSDQICAEIEGAEVEVIECQHMACWEADVVVIANPVNDINRLSEKIREVATQKIVAVLLKETDLQQLELVERGFPHSKVVGVIPSDYDKESVQLMTKHTRALRTVKEMVEKAGFKPLLKELKPH